MSEAVITLKTVPCREAVVCLADGGEEFARLEPAALAGANDAADTADYSMKAQDDFLASF